MSYFRLSVVESMSARHSKGRSSYLAPPTSPGDGDFWVFCDPEDSDFGKSMDLHGLSCSTENHEFANRAKGNFMAVNWHPLITVPALLYDSINCFQRLKGTDDASGKEAPRISRRSSISARR